MVTWWLLTRRGLPTELRIGVRNDVGSPKFHAWLEHEGRVINDRDDVGVRYAAFDRPIPPARARFD